MSAKSDVQYVIKKTGPAMGEIRKSAPRRFASNVAVPEIWRDQLDIIYEFLYRQPDYEQLCLEVAYVLKTKLIESNLDYSSITYRAKDLNSFLEKLGRKIYKEPFNDITDFAGVRLVCIYRSDLESIEQIIRREFKLVEKVDKSRKKSDRFGYRAVHFLVKLGEEFSGARYDHLKNLVCEIQLRTILQHAWATIDEHLVYKKKSSIPGEMSQRINHISQVLEEADIQFEKIRQERIEYIQALQRTRLQKNFLKREINLDSFKILVERSFPHAPDEDIRDFERVLKWIDSDKYKTVGDLNRVVEKASHRLGVVVKMLEDMLMRQSMTVQKWSNLELFHISMALEDPGYRKRAGISRGFHEILEKIESTGNKEEI